jgi:hypothetical protein
LSPTYIVTSSSSSETWLSKVKNLIRTGKVGNQSNHLTRVAI